MATLPDEARDELSFGPFRLIASERLLARDGVPVELGARAFDILVALISAPNGGVSKKDLMSRVWPDVTVEEGSLRFHMASLRKALGDGKDGARYITTLSGRGYCFVAPVSRASLARGAATEQRVHRRLAAILAADVVGFSALMQRAEESTYARSRGSGEN
jgi:DNA-binding winged helix-turn-helix (wHTH) protein